MAEGIIEELETHYVLFSVEGAAEGVIIKRLYESGLLVTPPQHIVRDVMTFEPFTRLRVAKKIAQSYLNVGYQTDTASELLVARIVDSETPSFVFPGQYKDMAIVRNFATSPEVEMLAIYKENKWNDWERQSRKNHNLKPSEYCMQNLGLREIKSTAFLLEYWDDAEELCSCIKQYAQHRPSRKKHDNTLLDLIK